MSQRLITSPHCAWHVTVDGNDLLIRGALASWFGGANDPEDDGQTASGVNTKKNPCLLGCALPLPTTPVTAGSPLPHLPWNTRVLVTAFRGPSLTIPLIDVGPDLSTNHPIDLTTAAFVALGGHLDDGLISVDYRILGGASALPGA